MCRSNRAEVFSVGISSAKNKYKMYKKKTSTKTIYFFAEIIHFFKKKKHPADENYVCKKKKQELTEKHVADIKLQIGSAEFPWRAFSVNHFCRRFFSRFCRNKNEIQQFFDFFSLTTWFI